MKQAAVKAKQLRTAALDHQGRMEILRVARVTTTKEQALECFRKRPLITIEEAEHDLQRSYSAADIRFFAAASGAFKDRDTFVFQPIPSLQEWQLMEDVSLANSQFARQGDELSVPKAIQELKRKYRARYDSASVEALRQRLIRARKKQAAWEAHAIRFWSAARRALIEEGAA